MSLIITEKQKKLLEKKLQSLERKFKNAVREEAKNMIGKDGWDAWDDEGYNAGLIKSNLIGSKIDRFIKVAQDAEVIIPEEQDQKVQIGNVVKLRHDDGSELLYVIEGYIVTNSIPCISIYSPVGEAIEGAKVGETRKFVVGDKTRQITVLKIYPPSSTDSLIPPEQQKED